MELIFDRVEGDVVVLSLDGGLDSMTTPQLEASLVKVIDIGVNRVVVDCAKLSYVSSSGLSGLLRMRSKMRDAGGDVALAGPRVCI